MKEVLILEHINDIEKAVANLNPNDLARFRAWWEDFDAIEWDHQFEDDALSGRLDNIAQKAVAEFNKGNCEEL